MKYLFSFLLFFGFTSLAIAQEETTLEDFEANEFMSSSGFSLPYRILKPYEFDATKRYPVVLFLHGAGVRGTDNEAQIKEGLSMFLKDANRQKYPCFVVVPQCPKESFWASVKADRSKTPNVFSFDYKNEITPSLEAAIELVNDLRMDQYVDTSRIYITGLSMGGMGTFEAVARYPELFAAAAPICGGGDAASFNKTTAQVPFYIFHGDADPIVPVDYSRQMYQRLLSLGGKVIYKEYAGVGHNSWENAYNEVTLLPWLFSKKKN